MASGTRDGALITPPYISFTTFIGFLNRLHTEGIPQFIDRHYWGPFMSGASGAQLMVALKFFGLIDPESSEPTDKLPALVDPEKRKGALREAINEAYRDLIASGIDLARTTPGRLESAFSQTYKAEGETRRKALTFFISASKHAELPLSNQLVSKSRNRKPVNLSNRVKPAPTKSKGRGQATPETEDKDTSSETIVSPKPALGFDSGPYSILQGLLAQLPESRAWSGDKRERWLSAVQATVDLLVDIVEPEELGSEEDLFDVEEVD